MERKEIHRRAVDYYNSRQSPEARRSLRGILDFLEKCGSVPSKGQAAKRSGVSHHTLNIHLKGMGLELEHLVGERIPLVKALPHEEVQSKVVQYYLSREQPEARENIKKLVEYLSTHELGRAPQVKVITNETGLNKQTIRRHRTAMGLELNDLAGREIEFPDAEWETRPAHRILSHEETQ